MVLCTFHIIFMLLSTAMLLLNKNIYLPILAALLSGFLLSGCETKSSSNLWNNYDYRRPAPAVDIPGGTTYSDYYGQYYQDNDSSYTAPEGYNCDASDIGCE